MYLFDNVAFSIGNFDVYWYAVCIFLGIVVAVTLGVREGEKFGITEDQILNGVFWIVPLSIVGARAYYCIFEYGFFSIFDIGTFFGFRDGGLAIHGGIIVAFVSAFFYCKKAGINILKIFDIMAPSFMIAQFMGRWGNFFNQEAHGAEIDKSLLYDKLHLPDYISDHMQVGYSYYHPTFLYEGMWNLTGFMIAMVIRRFKILKDGELFLAYIAWYGFGRYFVEKTRTDSLMFLDTDIKTNVVVSGLMFIVGVGLIIANRITKTSDDFYVDDLSY